MTLVAGHHRGNHRVLDRSDQEELTLDGQLPVDVGGRVVPGAGQAAGLPERDDGAAIGFLEGADVHGHEDSKRRAVICAVTRAVTFAGARASVLAGILAPMNFQMNPNSLFAILLRKPWWVSALIALAFCALAWAMLPPQWVVVGAAGSLPFVVIAAIGAWKGLGTPGESRITATVERLRAMSWPELAVVVTDAWKRDGHQVEPSHEPGADFEVVKAGRRGVIGARRWKVARLGVEPLRDLQAARERLEVRDCWYIVTGDVSEQARRFAATKRIELVEGVELARRIPAR